jgi:hypothetical protein
LFRYGVVLQAFLWSGCCSVVHILFGLIFGVSCFLLSFRRFCKGTRWNARGGVFDALPPQLSCHQLSGWAVVTGGNSGLGFDVAKGLSSCFSIVLGVRDVSSGETAKKQILAANPTV